MIFYCFHSAACHVLVDHQRRLLLTIFPTVQVCHRAILRVVLSIQEACQLYNVARLHQFRPQSRDLHDIQSRLSASIQKTAGHQTITNENEKLAKILCCY